MPSTQPPAADAEPKPLRRLGQRLRELRKGQRVSAVAAAQAAGMSRVTLHRIEKGEPGVAVGAWVALADALGARLDLVAPESDARRPDTAAAADTAALPSRIRLRDYPQLQALAWQLPGVTELDPPQALQLYERNWRHVELAQMSPAESALVRALAQAHGAGRLLV
jgi:transcriptional regulator with XRE-family HTH domain